MPEYRVSRKIYSSAWCYIEANNEEEAEQMAIENDVWYGDDNKYDDIYEVEEE